MDVAWKVGTGSLVDDWELRMSLRSFGSNYVSKQKFWVIGHIPNWLDNAQINCIPWPDPYKHSKDANLIHKALRLAMEADLSDPFIFCSDDQLLLKASTQNDFRLFHKGRIAKEATDSMNKWERRLINTGRRLRNFGFPAKHFDCHLPYPLHKEWIRESLRFDFATKPGMCVHTTILNGARQSGEPLRGDILGWLGQEGISDLAVADVIVNCRFAGLNNRSIRSSWIVSEIERIFPEPSPWEKDCRTFIPLSQRMERSSTSIGGELDVA